MVVQSEIDQRRCKLDLVAQNPLVDLRTVEPILMIDPVTRDLLILDPTIDSLLVDLKESDNIFDLEFHLTQIAALKYNAGLKSPN